MTNDGSDLSKLTCSSAEFGLLSAELLGSGNSIRFRAKGGSMHPLVREGDILVIAPCFLTGVKVGDVVLCSVENDRPLVHRVLRVRQNVAGKQFQVQGDQVAKPDGWIRQDHVHGCLVEVERDGKSLKMRSGKARFLGMIMVLSQRLGLRQSKTAGVVSGLLKRIPGFAGFLN